VVVTDLGDGVGGEIAQFPGAQSDAGEHLNDEPDAQVGMAAPLGIGIAGCRTMTSDVGLRPSSPQVRRSQDRVAPDRRHRPAGGLPTLVASEPSRKEQRSERRRHRLPSG
jgi:hypothetical protein